MRGAVAVGVELLLLLLLAPPAFDGDADAFLYIAVVCYLQRRYCAVVIRIVRAVLRCGSTVLRFGGGAGALTAKDKTGKFFGNVFNVSNTIQNQTHEGVF